MLAADLQVVLARTRHLWEELRGGRIFITGGTGFFGSWLLSSFAYANAELKLGAEAVVLTRDLAAFRRRSPSLANAAGISLHQGDVCSFEFPQGFFTHAVHAASELSVARPKDPLGLIEIALTGSRRVMEFAGERGVRKLLFTSSGAVYGPMVPGRCKIREDDPISAVPLTPAGAYAEAKRLAELTCAIAGSERGVEVKIARGFAFIGPFLPLDSHLAAAGFLKAALTSNKIEVQGHGRTIRSYLYGADLATWLWTILFAGRNERPYNLGSDTPVSIAELAESFAKAGKSPKPVQVLGQLKSDELIDVYLPDLTRARSELGLDVFTPLEEAICRSISFYA